VSSASNSHTRGVDGAAWVSCLSCNRTYKFNSVSQGTTAYVGERLREKTRQGVAPWGALDSACSKHPQTLIFSTHLHSRESGNAVRARGDRRTSSPPHPMLVERTSSGCKCANASTMLCATFCCKRLPLLLQDCGFMVLSVAFASKGRVATTLILHT